MASPKKKLRREDYHVAWIAPVSNLELLPARLMLDEKHDVPEYDTSYDDNIYTCGSMVGHNVVIASCPPGLIGNVNAGQVAGSMFKTFANIRMALLVGIGGGVPRSPNSDRRTPDVRLGDVVVGWPGDGKPACVYYDLGKRHTDGRFEMSGTIDRPDRVLLNALGALESDHEMDETNFQEHRERLLAWKGKRNFAFPGLEEDLLFQADYKHDEESMEGCASCDTSKLVDRPARTEADAAGFIFHRGRIATGNAVVRTGVERDEISERCGGVLCIEMEAAGVDASRPCLVVRGISDYADSHKSDVWQSYAAGNAVVFSRELLRKIPPSKVLGMEGSSSKVSESKAPFIFPFVRNAQFAGRESQLQQLKEHVRTRGSQRLAVHGLGGCGKTALVAELAYQLRDEDPGCAIFWVPALNAETFERAYQEIGVALGIPQIHNDRISDRNDSRNTASGANVDIMSLVKDRLSSNDCRPWLLIIDNADDARLLLDSKATGLGKRLLDYLPQSDKGSFIFTTRSLKAAVDLANTPLELTQLEEGEAVEFIKKRLSHLDLLGDDAVVKEFLEILTYLPLAIVQAVAFINRNAVSLQQYIDLLGDAAETELRLLNEGFEDHTRYQDDVENNAVARTWRISFQQIRIDDPLAARYLEFIACLQRENIPTSIFESDDAIAKAKALGTLKAYAFITVRAPQGQSMTGMALAEEFYDMHRLENKLTESLLVLIGLLPRDGTHEGWRIWVAYIPHCIHLASLCSGEGNIVQDKIELLFRIGSCQLALGQYRAMEKTSQEAWSLCKTAYGEEHEDTLRAMNEVGVALSEQGRYEEAEMMHRKTQALVEKVLGKEHPGTLASMSNLGQALRRLNKYAEAEIMHRETLALREKVHGKEHPSTLVSMSDLGLVLGDQGKHAEAEAMYRETLILQEKVLGREHPETLTTMYNIGWAINNQGQYAEAETIHREVLVLRKKILGEEHPKTLGSMYTIGMVLADQGKHTEAETVHRETLVLEQRILGKEHPHTLTSMNNLGVATRKQGRYTEAENMYRETLVLMKKVLGMEHSYTMTTRGNLAGLLRYQGKHEEADLLMSRITDV
ncbi:hypothetical protein PG984_005307 [Apiospora sp. TS-2023a]